MPTSSRIALFLHSLISRFSMLLMYILIFLLLLSPSSAMMPPPLPLPSASSSLRLGTFNLGLGFLRKLPHILDRSTALSLDIIALQEVGDPAVLTSKLPQYNLVYSGGPSQHEAGVALLISHDLASRCRTYKRSKTGRLVAAVLEITKGHQMLVASAYMPSGLDGRSSVDPSTVLAHQLYAELMAWTVGMQQVIILGDLNETLTADDRFPRPHIPLARAAASSPIQCMQHERFIDVYRHLHPSALHQPGFTHAIDNVRHSLRSRIDYIWTRGTPPASLTAVSIDTRLQHLSHHHLLWMEMQLHTPLPLPCTASLLHACLPNLRHLSEHSRAEFCDHVEAQMDKQSHALLSMGPLDDCDSISAFATALTTITRDAAFDKLPVTGSSPKRNKTVIRLDKQRRDLTRLLRISTIIIDQGDDLTLSPEWRQLHRLCIEQHQLQWHVDAYYHHDDAAWMAETQQLIRATRTAMRRECHRLTKARKPPLDSSPAAAVHRMLQSDAFPSQLYSVVDSSGQLTSNAAEMEDVMVQHFETVFSIPDRAAAPPLPHAPPAMLFDKPGVDAHWYDDLMMDVSEQELLSILSDIPLVSAPGQDEVSTGVWKVALQGSPSLLKHVTTLFTACLRTATFPTPWKTSVILPFIKDAQKEKSMSNIRPISLQACLGKLFSKLLAHRLGSIFARHPILNPSQRGFIIGGATAKCIDELIDTWEWSRKGGCELYTLFYDIKQAYDSVETDVLTRAMRRLHLPEAFIALIADSLADLTSCIRTVYGRTRLFRVLRSLRQGDPLAPLLFVILMDALHDGLERNPFTHQQHGCRLTWPGSSIYIPSLGYADDTAAITTSLVDLRAQNEWVQYFMAFNRLRLNPLKCELVGRGADGAAVTDAAVAAHNINVDGHILRPLPHSHAIRYLGVHARFDGCWSSQQQKAREMIMLFTRAVSKFSTSVKQAVYMFNVFLLPKLELALHYVHGPNTAKWISGCDRLLFGCIKHLVASPLHLSHSAVALITGLRVPSWMEVCVKGSELFIRMNSSDDRWGQLGRVLMRHNVSATVDATTRLHGPNGGSRIARAAYLTVHVLRWSLHLAEERRPGSRHAHLFDVDALPALPTADQCSSTALVDLIGGQQHIAHDVWCGWSTAADPPQQVDVYTDGSYDASSSTSAWSIAVGDRWLQDNYLTVPSDETQLHAGHLAGCTLIGGNITCSNGIYPAELQAIARVLAAFPLTVRLHIHSDSEASIAAITAYQLQPNERKRLRMSARPLLRLIHHLLARRTAAGSITDFSHVAAHSEDTDIDSVGNRMADYQANHARTNPARSRPHSLRQLPLAACEPHLHVCDEAGMAVIDDLRCAIWSLRQSQVMTKWQAKADQGVFAGAGMVELGSAALHSSALQSTLLHVATNSMQYQWVDGADAADAATLQQLQCAACHTTMTLLHLAVCPDAPASAYRHQLRIDILGLIAEFDDADSWYYRHCRQQLPSLIHRLFPPPRDVRLAADRQPLILHSARCLIGAFTVAEGSAVSTAIGLKDATQKQMFVTRLRRLCLAAVDDLYAPLKEPP